MLLCFAAIRRLEKAVSATAFFNKLAARDREDRYLVLFSRQGNRDIRLQDC